MGRRPDWTIEEFDHLLDHSHLPADELIKRFPLRSPGTVDAVRQGLHSYHRDGDVSSLSRLMVRRLEDNRGTIVCPVCGARI